MAGREETRRPSLVSRAAWGAALGAGSAFVANDMYMGRALSLTDDGSLLIVAFITVSALLGAARLRPLLVGALAALALLWLVVAWTPLTRALAAGLTRRDEPAPADAVYVLASAVRQNGDLSAEALARLVHGLELVHDGLAPRLILSELDPPANHYAEGAARIMRRFGIATELVAVGPVHTTHDEAVLVGKLCRERGLTRLLLVTSPYHSRRAAAAFEAEGLTVISSPSMEPRYDVDFLEHPDDRLRAFADIVHERLGAWIYARRGWLRPE
jgi:uncharacterized SAM-binding protein YcdF (DUF218 family)